MERPSAKGGKRTLRAKPLSDILWPSLKRENAPLVPPKSWREIENEKSRQIISAQLHRYDPIFLLVALCVGPALGLARSSIAAVAEKGACPSGAIDCWSYGQLSYAVPLFSLSLIPIVGIWLLALPSQVRTLFNVLYVLAPLATALAIFAVIRDTSNVAAIVPAGFQIRPAGAIEPISYAWPDIKNIQGVCSAGKGGRHVNMYFAMRDGRTITYAYEKWYSVVISNPSIVGGLARVPYSINDMSLCRDWYNLLPLQRPV